MTTCIAVHGALGRMGKAVIRALATTDGVRLVAAIERPGHPDVGRDAGSLAGVEPMDVLVSSALGSALDQADVVIDFSLPQSSTGLLRAAATAGTSVVVGTTGGSEEWEAALAQVATKAPVVAAANFSPGVAVLLDIAKQATSLLGEAYDAEIVEMHHRHKVDSPSGTARRLAEAVAASKGLGQDAWVHGREGQVGRRGHDEIGVLSLRGGGVIGDHTLILASSDESIEITHRARSRDVFAGGAVRAALWVVSKPAGVYGIKDVLSG